MLKGKIDKSFFVTNCDSILEGDVSEIIHWHLESKNLLTVIGSHKEIDIPYGVLETNNGNLKKITEKPKLDLFVNTGSYIIEPEVLEMIPENQFLDMDALLVRLQDSYPDKVGVYPHVGRWLDYGQWDEYQKNLKYIDSDWD